MLWHYYLSQISGDNFEQTFFNNLVSYQLTVACSNSTIETLGKGVKYVQS